MGLYSGIQGYIGLGPEPCIQCMQGSGPRAHQQHDPLYAIKDHAAGIGRHKVKDDVPDYREEQCYFRPDEECDCYHECCLARTMVAMRHGRS